ncbi:uncharacterized protein LOC129975448 [Argiope bruennichi]|uniref:uncharacterized protein LOC129975448 n=1 Tax=Argiope bruennichi TaxID=94029 RepID=UPI0024942DAF|nr:uncharacterized protein LOC129975448 [Argiope bruennichi]
MMEELDFDDEVLSIHPDEDIKKIESIEVDVNSNFEHNSDSDSGEIDDEEEEEANDLEEGEIKDNSPVSKKKSEIACRFFKRGSCAFGSQCQYLHVSDSVYKMFDTNPQRRNDLQYGEHHDFPKPLIFPPNIPPPRPFMQPPISVAPKPDFHRQYETCEDNWEKGLEQAKILIRKANLKRKSDGCESKKFNVKNNKEEKLKGQHFTKTNLDNELDFDGKKYFEKSLTNKSLHREEAHDERRSNYRYQRRSNDKWVDPWRRSKSPLNKKRLRSLSGSPPSHSRKHSYASSTSSTSSSSSEIDDIYRRPYEKKSPRDQQRFVSRSRSISQSRQPKKRRISPKRSFNERRNSRSASRSFSRSPYRKGAFSSRTRSRSSSSSSCSDCQKSPAVENDDMKRISDKLSEQLYEKSPTRASPLLESDCETSEMTVSSASCTPLSSDFETESPHHSPSLKIKEEIIEDDTSFYPNKSKIFTDQKISNKNQSNLLRNQNLMQNEDDVKPTFLKKIHPCKNNGKKINNWDLKTGSADCKLKNASSYFNPVEKPASTPDFSKNKMLDDPELFFRHQGPRNSNNSCSIVQKVKPNKPEGAVIVAQKPNNNSESYGNASKLGSVRKQNIVLNLQPKSKDCFKPETLNKQQNADEMSTIHKKETASKREQLLNKLKLIDDAIARKKSSNAY